MSNELICDSKQSALKILEIISASLDKGTPREALRAVSSFIQREVSDFVSLEDRAEMFKKLFEKTPGEKLFDNWYEAGCHKNAKGEYINNTEPENGAEGNCRYNANTGRWEPTLIPPLILPQKECIPSNDDE